MFVLKLLSFFVLSSCVLSAEIFENSKFLLTESLPEIEEPKLQEDPLTAPGNDYDTRDFILSWQARRALRKILAQMPCGWSEYNIPPLAPYATENATLGYESNFTSFKANFETLRIDGLDDIEINKLSVSYFLKRIDFDFTFPNITLSGKFDSSFFIDVTQAANFNFKLNANGDMHLTFLNLNFSGLLRYKLPIFSGSAKIVLFKPKMSVENVISAFTGRVNKIPIGKGFNDLIEKSIISAINEQQLYWSAMMEQKLVPIANSLLEGQTLWKLILWAINRDSAITCPTTNDKNIETEELMELLLRHEMS